MSIEIQASTETLRDNVLSNNTVDLELVDKYLNKGYCSSYDKLYKYQLEEINLGRYVITQDNLYKDVNGNLCFSINRDLLHKSFKYKNKNNNGNNFIPLSDLYTNNELSNHLTSLPLIFNNEDRIIIQGIKYRFNNNDFMEFSIDKTLYEINKNNFNFKIFTFPNTVYKTDLYLDGNNVERESGSGTSYTNIYNLQNSIGREYANSNVFMVFNKNNVKPRMDYDGAYILPAYIDSNRKLRFNSSFGHIQNLANRFGSGGYDSGFWFELIILGKETGWFGDFSMNMIYELDNDDYDTLEDLKTTIREGAKRIWATVFPTRNFIIERMDIGYDKKVHTLFIPEKRVNNNIVAIENFITIKYNAGGNCFLSTTKYEPINTNYPLLQGDCNRVSYRMFDIVQRETNTMMYLYFYKENKDKYYDKRKPHIDALTKYLCKLVRIDYSEMYHTHEHDPNGQSVYFKHIMPEEFFIREMMKYVSGIHNFIDKLIGTYYFDFTYSEKEYLKSTKPPFHTDYRVEKFFELIKKDPSYFKDYINDTTTPQYKYTVPVSTLDLPSRLRTNTNQDIPDLNIDLGEAYLFKYVAKEYDVINKHDNFVIFVDGELLNVDEMIVAFRKNTYYIYIKKNKIKPNSVIELNRYMTIGNDILEDESLRFTLQRTDDFFVFDLKESKYLGEIDLDDIFIIDVATKEIVSNNNFEFYIMHNGEKIVIGPNIGADNITDVINNRILVKFMKFDKLYIRSDVGSSLHRELSIGIGHSFNRFGIQITPSFDVKYEIPREFDVAIYKPEKLITFVNGRYFPLQFIVYNEVDATNVSEPKTKTYIEFKTIPPANAYINLLITPFTYKIEYIKDVIPDGFHLDLSNVLSKPFSLDYYDVYVNGRKLNRSNIVALSPNKIKLFNLQSRKNLIILERDRDVEFFSLKNFNDYFENEVFKESSLPNIYLYNILEDIVNTQLGDDFKNYVNEGITDDEPIVGGRVFKPQAEFLFYTNVILPEGVTKPNTFSVDLENIRKKYNKVYIDYVSGNRLVIRPSKYYNAERVLRIGKNDTTVSSD